MIWNDASSTQTEQAWADYVAARVAEGCGPEVVSAEPAVCAAVGEAVGAFLAAHADRKPLATADVSYMIVRALWAFGRPDLAQDWAERQGPAAGLGRLADLALSGQASWHTWRAVFSSGLVRQSRSELAAGNAWVLDFEALSRCLECPWELAVFTAVNALVDQVAWVWDRTRGQGVLGLWHTACIQPGGSGRRAGRRSRSGWAGELRARCDDRLALQRESRGWTATPGTVLLDLG